MTDLNDKRTTYSTLIVALSLVMLSGCATAETFKEFDADGSGLISKSEADQARNLADIFQTADFNEDGGLDTEEFALAEEAIKRGRTSEKRRLMGTEKGGPKRR